MAAHDRSVTARVEEGGRSQHVHRGRPRRRAAVLYRLPLASSSPPASSWPASCAPPAPARAPGRVAGLRRPSISAWAANQLARAAPHAMAELLDAGAALQAAQRAVLAGRPDAARGLRTAGAHLRAAIVRLTQRAETLLHRAGHAARRAAQAREALQHAQAMADR